MHACLKMCSTSSSGRATIAITGEPQSATAEFGSTFFHLVRHVFGDFFGNLPQLLRPASTTTRSCRERRKRRVRSARCTSGTKGIPGVRVCGYRCPSLSSTTEPSARFIDSPGGTGRHGDFRQAPEGCRGLSSASKRQELSFLVQRAGLSKRASGAAGCRMGRCERWNLAAS